MSFKEWQAVVQILGVVAVTVWLVLDPVGVSAEAGMAALAWQLVWAFVALIAFNILATIVVTILVSIVRGEELKDERADERDRAIETLSSRNGYVVTSAAAALVLLPLAFGVDPSLAIYALLGAPMLGGVAHAASLLVYYRIG
jgi:uncharacterized membrane protein